MPADIGRHSGRPYDSTRLKFFFRFDWTLAARGDVCMKLRIVGTANRSLRRAQAEWNIEQEISNDEVWNRCALTISD